MPFPGNAPRPVSRLEYIFPETRTAAECLHDPVGHILPDGETFRRYAEIRLRFGDQCLDSIEYRLQQEEPCLDHKSHTLKSGEHCPGLSVISTATKKIF